MKRSGVKVEDQEYELIIAQSIDDVIREWQSITPNTIFANYDYLKLLEKNGPVGYGYYYAVLLKDDSPVASVYFQRKRVKLSDDFRVHAHGHSNMEKLRVAFLKRFFSFVKHDILICGNVLLTGEYAYGRSENFEIKKPLFDTLFEKVIQYIREKESIKIQSMLCKDFFQEGEHQLQSFEASGFFEFQVQPAMIFKFNSEWASFQDFLASVKSKYRVKFKKVMKKGSSLTFKKLSNTEAWHYNEQMYNLYKSTADRATFSLFTLDKDYFARLKETLGDDLTLTAILNGEELLGFYTFVNDGTHADAHFLGYDVKQNSKYQIYFNILLKLIEEGILNNAQFLNLSRTALEIKSSVGAEPHNMYVYLKHQNKLINKVLPWILNRVVPKNDWEQRSPFK